MVREQNKKNLKTEQKGINLLDNTFPNFLIPNKDQKVKILNIMGINRKRFIRTFDGLLLKVKKFEDIKSYHDFEFVEVKNTDKSLKNFPSRFFFGFTLNEECLLRVFDNFSIIFVNVKTGEYTHFMKYDEYDSLISNKRTQYQIHFKNFD